jgi:cellulose biosynthesis protein BcsQ
MTYLSTDNLAKSYGPKPLFKCLTFGIARGDKTALIAQNGTGKSTLLKILAGREVPDEGEVMVRNGIRIGFLEQEPQLDESMTISEFISQGHSELARIVQAYEKAAEEQARDFNPATQKAFEDATAAMDTANAWDYEQRLEQILGRDALAGYDLVVIDSPPSLNILSINVLVAADSLIVPIEPHPLSLMVLRRLFETVERIRRLNPRLGIVGFLPTKVHHSSRLAVDMIDMLREQFPEIELLPAIPLSVKSAESIAEFTSILQYMPRSPLSAAYREVAETLEHRIGEEARHVG